MLASMLFGVLLLLFQSFSSSLAQTSRGITVPNLDTPVDAARIPVAWRLQEWDVAQRGGEHFWIAIGDGRFPDELGTVQLVQHIGVKDGEALVSASEHPTLKPGSRAAVIVIRVAQSLHRTIEKGQVLKMPRERSGPGFSVILFDWVTLSA